MPESEVGVAEPEVAGAEPEAGVAGAEPEVAVVVLEAGAEQP